MTAVISAWILKKLIKISEFLCSHFNTEGGRKYATFGASFIVLRKVKMQLKQKNICAVCGEGAGTDKHVKSGLQSFVLQISLWTVLHGRVDQLLLIAIQSRH